MKGGYGESAESKAGDFLKGISQIRTAKTLQSSGLLSDDKFIDTPVNELVKDSRQLSKLKAELVRNKIVTRANLMKLYQPPATSGIRVAPIPRYNPWYNGEIVTQSQQVSQQSSKFLEKEMNNNLFGKASLTNQSGYNTVIGSEAGFSYR